MNFVDKPIRKHYDYLIVGAGLTGAVFSNAAVHAGKSVLLIDRRSHIAGNIYTDRTKSGIDVHKYGAHIFHTSDEAVWAYVNQFADFSEVVFLAGSPLLQAGLSFR